MSTLGNKEVMAQNIKRYMQVFGIDRKEFCQRLGFKYSTVTDWLNAEKYPRIDKIELMANFFKINKSDLVEPYLPTSAPSPSDQEYIEKYQSLSQANKQVVNQLIDNLVSIEECYQGENAGA